MKKIAGLLSALFLLATAGAAQALSPVEHLEVVGNQLQFRMGNTPISVGSIDLKNDIVVPSAQSLVDALASMGSAGPIAITANPSITPFTGHYGNQSYDYYLDASGIFMSTGINIKSPSVIGTYSKDPVAPFVNPDIADIGQSMVLINAMSTNPNNGEQAFDVNLSVTYQLAKLSNPNTQKVALQTNVLVAATGGDGSCSDYTCPAVWAANPDFEARGVQGQLALGINTEFDYNNRYAGTDAFQVNLWVTYGGDYPVTAGIYFTNQFTDTYTASVTVTGNNVVVNSGTAPTGITPGVYIAGTANSNFRHITGRNGTTSFTVDGAAPPQGSQTLQWSPAAQQFGILMTDSSPSTPLTSTTDIILNTSGYDALQIGGNHVVSISLTNDMASTGLSLRGNPNGAGQQICFDSFDGCQLDYGGPGRHLFTAAAGETFEIDAVGAGNNYIVVTNALDSGTENPALAFNRTGPSITINGTGFDDLNLQANGPHASVRMLSMLKLNAYGIAQLPPCQNDTDGDMLYVYDGNGAPAGATFHGQVTAATAGQTPSFINSPAYCDSGIWRYM